MKWLTPYTENRTKRKPMQPLYVFNMSCACSYSLCALAQFPQDDPFCISWQQQEHRIFAPRTLWGTSAATKGTLERTANELDPPSCRVVNMALAHEF